jgi:hypothetical protein
VRIWIAWGIPPEDFSRYVFAGPLPVNKGGLFYMSNPSNVMPKTTSIYTEAA